MASSGEEDELHRSVEAATMARRPIVAPGARGAAVVELKRLLRSWYARRGTAPPRRMRGPAYGTGAAQAVKEFQQAHGLTVDGVVGPETWAALLELASERG
jgi:peptidoglycan hydrolase-like protein with peptidoglycan-binding domain